ncbi:GAP family protein [Rhodococcus sp. SGAir0479]|uniref:GAP family protein n=1 Tax=Rhodococcus sp. SGAir0479 TaxID=2567884 RepID=UPI0010CCB21F|nr:GAP family protein [Rhodococcus sp. SGAir0479]QCQ93121.1 hypothetical protein E7742_19125 [Rhodococcus sp. SGAir0479]
MGNPVAQLVPVGIGMIVNPAPFAVLVAILLSARARTNATLFTTTGIAASAVLIGVTAFTADANVSPGAHRLQLVFALLVGLVFAALAVLGWTSRPPRGEAAVMPSWMARLDRMGRREAAASGLALAVVNARNLPLELRAGGLIAQARVSPAQAVLSSAGVAVLGGVGLIALSVLAAVTCRPVAAALGVVRTELIQHNATIVTAVFALLAGVQLAHVVSAATALG